MIAPLLTKKDLFEEFQPGSKIWVYTSNRLLNEKEILEISELISGFTKDWTAHDKALKASGRILYGHFIVFCVDESQATASGCSIDKSVHFIKDIESRFGLNLFDRLLVYYLSGNQIRYFHLNELAEKVAQGEISRETMIFDTTITGLGSFQNDFVKYAGKSWLAKFLG